MRTIKDWIDHAKLLYAQAQPWGYSHGFTSQQYFDALKPYYKFLDEAEEIIVVTKPRGEE